MMRAMPNDRDIFRAAHAMNVQHGADAPIHAVMRTDAILDAGDIEGQAVWRRILGALATPIDPSKQNKG
jgi:hypothetical protein